MENGHITNDESQIASTLNNHFSSVFSKDMNHIPPQIAHSPISIPKLNITTDTVKQYISKLNPYKSPGPDKIHSRM